MPEVDNRYCRLGILGYPLGHSLSPIMHDFLLAELGVEGSYERVEATPEELPTAVQRLAAERYRGFNVTIPHKQSIMDCLSDIDEQARHMGAVNTVLAVDGKLRGFNTDGRGFYQSCVRNDVQIGGRVAIVLGAGGAARAIIFTLIEYGIEKLLLFNRNLSRLRQLTTQIRESTGFTNVELNPLSNEMISVGLKGSDIMINTTPLGMWPKVDATPFTFDSWVHKLTVVDLVYNPLKTRFLKTAETAGAKIFDGLDMFMYQGIEALKIWLGKGDAIAFDYGKLRKHLIEKAGIHESP